MFEGGEKKKEKKIRTEKTHESFPGLQKHTRAVMVRLAMDVYKVSTYAFVMQPNGRVHGKVIDQTDICGLSACVSLMSALHNTCRDSGLCKFGYACAYGTAVPIKLLGLIAKQDVFTGSRL